MTVTEAERYIAVILETLELFTGQLVRGISCHAIDITTMHDDRPVHHMKVCVELERLPGHQW